MYGFCAYFKLSKFFRLFANDEYILIFFTTELTYNHTIKLDDEALTFDIRDAVEKVIKLLFIQLWVRY